MVLPQRYQLRFCSKIPHRNSAQARSFPHQTSVRNIPRGLRCRSWSWTLVVLDTVRPRCLVPPPPPAHPDVRGVRTATRVCVHCIVAECREARVRSGAVCHRGIVVLWCHGKNKQNSQPAASQPCCRRWLAPSSWLCRARAGPL